MYALYDALAPLWAHLRTDRRAEAQQILRWAPDERPLLELGSGSGALAVCLAEHRTVELLDASEAMLAVSSAQLPGATHHHQDLRSFTTGRQYGTIVLHDAVMYLTTEACLRAAYARAAAHLVPGGTFIVLPDAFADDFVEHVSTGTFTLPDGALVLTEWHWDPDPNDDTVQCEFQLLLREGTTVRSLHETHRMGCFSMQTHLRALEDAGLRVDPLPVRDLRAEGAALRAVRP